MKVTAMYSSEIKMRLELALEAAQMAVWDSEIHGPDVGDSYVIWSAKGAELLGRKPHPLQHRFNEFLLCVHPDDRQYVRHTLQQAIDLCTDYALEYRVVWPDSSVHWLAAKAQVFCGADGAALRTLGIIWDLTTRKQIELETAEKKRVDGSLKSTSPPR